MAKLQKLLSEDNAAGIIGRMMKKIALMGASGHGKVVADAAMMLGYNINFYDDAWPERQLNGRWPIAGDSESLIACLPHYDGVLVTIGHNGNRLQQFQRLCRSGARLVSVIHPSAVVSDFSSIGEGSVVFANAVVNVDVSIGCGAIINTSASIDHDCKLGDFVHISPGANLAGSVSVGDCTWIGIGASVRQGVKIGSNVLVAAGAVVVSDIPDGIQVAGVPAKRMLT